MYNFVIKIAGLNIAISSKYEYTFCACKDYLIDTNDIDFNVTCLDEEIKNYSINSSLEYGEFIAVYERIAKRLPEFNRALIHAASIEYKGKAYIFLAPSGTGKTTHIKHLLSQYKDIHIINGDKPIIDEKGLIYGTPWAGKEKLQSNSSYPLAAIFLLFRDTYDHVEEVNKSDYLDFILNEIYKDSNFSKSINIINSAFNNIPTYKLSVTKNIEAASISYNIMNK